MIKYWVGDVKLRFPCGCKVQIGFEENNILDDDSWIEEIYTCSKHDEEQIKEEVNESIWRIIDYLKEEFGPIYKTCEKGEVEIKQPIEEFLKTIKEADYC